MKILRVFVIEMRGKTHQEVIERKRGKEREKMKCVDTVHVM